MGLPTTVGVVWAAPYLYCASCAPVPRGYGSALPVAVVWDDRICGVGARSSSDAWLLGSEQRDDAVSRRTGLPLDWHESGDILGQSRSFRDYKAICERSELVFLDHQTRNDATGFQANGDIGKLIHGLLGWDKLAPESMAMYQSPSPTFRVASRPEPEARMWMVEGFAGGIQPWWHHIGAYHEDRRQYQKRNP